VGPTASLEAVVKIFPAPARTRTPDHPARSLALFEGLEEMMTNLRQDMARLEVLG
jgi:hypothetical protein